MGRQKKSWGALHHEWMVLDHGPLESLAENIWRVTGALPEMGGLHRQMIVIKLNSGGLLIHNGICLDDDAMDELEKLGAPEVLIVPCGWHRMDAAAWRARYPELVVYCPAGAREQVSEIVNVDGDYDELDAERIAPVTVRHVAGINEAEGVFTIPSDDGVTLLFNDLIFNQPHLSGAFGLLYRVLGSSGGPRITRIVRMKVVKDKRACRADLEALAETEDLVRVVPGHGFVIDEDAGESLKRIAAWLS